jgi:HK97 gp10 family phage protein
MASKKDDGGLAAFEKRLKALANAPDAMIDKALLRAAKRVQAKQKDRAPVDTGALRDSITVTPPGGTAPAYSQMGGNAQAGEHEVLITAGNSEVRYAHFPEFGTSKMEAQSYFLNTFHEERPKELRNIKRAGLKAIRDANAGKKIDD